MNNTIIIVIAVVVIWAVLFAVMMTLNKKRQERSQAFENENRGKALVHLYGRNLKINGRDISGFAPITGKDLEKVVALDEGHYSFEGIFETTYIGLTGKTVNLKTEKLQFELDLERGQSYNVGLYKYSADDAGNSEGEDVLTIPLSLYEGSEHVSANVIVWKKNEK